MNHCSPSARCLPLHLLTASLLLTLISSAAWAEGAEWVQFRGPGVDGVSTETAVFEGLEDVGLQVAWKQAIGSGYSGISIADGRAVTMFVAGEHDVIASFDVETGVEQWRYAFAPTYGGHDGSHDGPISTPLLADGRVFSLGPWGQFFALDLATGEKIWQTHLVDDHEIAKPHYGFATSPLLEGGVLVLELGGEDAAVAGFDPSTGELRWKVGSDQVASQTPVPWTFDGRRQVVAAGMKHLFGIDAATGELLWQIDHEGRGGPGVASMTAVPVGEGKLFLAHQADGSMLIDLQREGETVSFEKVWEGRAIRNSYNIPVYHEGHLYAYSSRFLTCVDVATGEARWRSRQPGDGFLSLVDGHLVIATKAGGVYVAKASPEGYEELAGMEVFSDIAWTAPSIAGGSIYVRSTGELARIEFASGGAAGGVQMAHDTSSPFGRFLAEVEAAEPAQKNDLVDAFFAAQKSFPVISNGRVHFLYRGPAQDVALAGFMFGARREEPMQRIKGTDVFHYTLELEEDARIDYVFFVDFKEQRDPLNPRQSGFTVVTSEMEMSMGGEEFPMSWVTMPKWEAPAHLKAAPEGSRGTFKEHELANEALGERKIGLTVYLPEGYEAEGEARYPLAVVHGGREAIERGDVANSLDNLIGKTVTPVVVAFLDLPMQGPLYSKIFSEDVVPFLEETYRLRDEASSRAHLGGGFSGSMALLLTLGDQGFGKAGAQSPFMFSQLEAMAQQMIAGVGEATPQIYLEWGKYDYRNPHEGWDMAEVGRSLVTQLTAQGIEPMGGEVHDSTDWPSWRNRTDRIFEALFPLKPGS